MTQLINITKQGGNQVVNARELHQFLEVSTDFKNWIKRRINDYKFVENEDFVLVVKQGIPKEKSIIQKTEITHSECPPIFDLTNLTDGKYYTYMLACGLGGQVEINLKTEDE